MKKILFVLVPILLILLVIVAVMYFGAHTSTTPTSQTPSTTGFPVSSGNPVSSTEPTQSSTVTVSAFNGSTIPTKDFLHDPATSPDPVNNGYYYLGYNNFNGTNDIPYMIEYISSTKYFNIELLQEPVGQTRIAAETYLMQHLGITQQQMCELNYSIGVPDYVNSVYSSENLGFSFCPGAVALPQ